ncbi:thiolase family protein [Neobacillus niacini]|uniref:thiolase family protein n=1 Tax=Neobacillus niacini TaxID=86668 RepID=UPI002FFE5653
MTIKKDAYAIVGLGVTKQGRFKDLTHEDIKVDAMRLALSDAGLKAKDIDGWVYQRGGIDKNILMSGGVVPKILGFDPGFMMDIQCGGATTILAIMTACAALDSGQSKYVAVGYGDTLSQMRQMGSSDFFGDSDRDTNGSFGMFSFIADHALAAKRHMDIFGTTKEQLGTIALTQREHAHLRPEAFMHGKPLTMEDYLNSKRVADPLGKYDCCLTADGGCAFIITTAERAKDLKQRPVYISGFGFGHDLGPVYNRTQYEQWGIERAKQQTLRMAGVTIDEIDVAQIYDCFTIAVLMQLEGWGFCKQGEGGSFIEEGHLKLTGKLPTNTSGGELSFGYMQGFTPLAEGVRQLRGEAGATQVKDAELCLVTGHGGSTPDGVGNHEYAEAGLILRRG